MSQRRVGMKTHLEVQARAEAAEALAADHENQIAELCMGLDQAEGRVAELEEALEAARKSLPTDPSLNEPWSLALAIMDEALSGDGSSIMDVRSNLQAIQIRCREGDKKSNWLPIIDGLATEALDRLDPEQESDR